MFQSLAETVLLQILSPYFQGISRENVHLGVYSGRLLLNNIKVKPEVLSSLGFFVNSGQVESLEVRFPWTDILSGRLAITISGANLELVKTFEPVFLSRRQMIDRAKAVLHQQLLDSIASSTQLSMLAKLSRRIISNLSITITNVQASLTVDETMVTMEIASILVDSLIEAEAAILTGIVDKRLKITGFKATMGSSEILRPLSLTVRARLHSIDKSLLLLVQSGDETGVCIDKSEVEALMLLIDLINKADALTVQMMKDDGDVPPLANEATIYEQYMTAYSDKDQTALRNISRQVSITTAATWEFQSESKPAIEARRSLAGVQFTTEALEQPAAFSITLDLGHLSILLKERGEEVISGELRGFYCDCQVRLNRTDLEITTHSMHASYCREPIIFFEPKSQGGVAQFCSVGIEGSLLSVDYRACPLILDYRKGLLPTLYRFIDVLAPVAPARSAVLERLAAYRPQLEATMLTLALDLDAPLIKLPIADGLKAFVSLGQFELNMSPDLSFIATLSKVSLQSVDTRSVTVLAPTGLSLAGQLSPKFTLDLELDDSVRINLNYDSLALVQEGINLVMQELFGSKPSSIVVAEAAATDVYETQITGKFKGAEIKWTDSLLVRSKVDAFAISMKPDGAMTYRIDNITFDLSTLHPTGVWEPLMEICKWDLFLSFPTLKSIDFTITALSPINLNVTPLNIKTLLKAISFIDHKGDDQLRVVNASNEPVTVNGGVVERGADRVCHIIAESINIGDIAISTNSVCAVVLKSGAIARLVSDRVILISSKVLVANMCQVPLKLNASVRASLPVSWLGLSARECTTSTSDDDVLVPGHFVSVNDSFQVLFPKHASWSEVVHYPFNDGLLVVGDRALRVEVERGDGYVVVKLMPCLTLTNQWPVDLFVKIGSDTSEILCINGFSEVDISTVDSLNDVKERGLLVGLSTILMTVGIDHLTNRDVSEVRLNLAVECIATKFPMTMQYSVGQVTFKTERLLIDLTDEKLLFFCGGQRLPSAKTKSSCPIWLLPSLDSEEKIECMEPGYPHMQIQVPASFWSFDKLVSGLHVTLKVEERDGCSVVLITPRYRAVNALPYSLTLRSGKVLEPGCSKVLKRGALDVQDWREIVPLEQKAVGSWSLFTKSAKVVTLDIVPHEGVTTVSILPDPLYVIHNQTSHSVRFCMEGEHKWLTVRAHESSPLGWKYPFTAASPSVTVDLGAEAIKVDLSLVYHGQSNYVKLATGLSHPRSIDLVVLNRTRESHIDQYSFKIALAIPAISLSLCHSSTEVLYTEVSLIRAVYVGDTRGSQQLELLVSDMQIESGARGRQHHPAVIHNKGKDGAPFIKLSVDGVASQATDAFVLKQATIEADKLVIDFDDAVLESCASFVKDLIPKQLTSGPSLITWLSSMLPVCEQQIDPIPLPPLITVAKLTTSDIKLKLWVSLSIANLENVSAVMKLFLRVVTISGKFKIHGAKLSLKHREFQAFRGPIPEYLTFLQSEYGVALFTALVSLLSKSSLLNIPLYPIKVLSKTGSIGIGSIGTAVNDVGSAIDNLVFDKDYAASQHAMRQKKEITSMGGGLHEGAKRAMEGVEGLFDIFRQPIVGARDHGVSGFIKGIGKGIVGTVVKPVAKVGEAIGDITTGMSKLAAYGDVSKGRPVSVRRRLPRAFYGGNGLIQEYSKVDAVLLSLVGEQVLSDAVAVVVVPVKNNPVNVLGLLLLHDDQLRYMEIDLQKEALVSSWKMQGSDIKRVNIAEGNWLVLTDTMNLSERCKLPQDETLAKAMMSELLLHKASGQFDWRSWLNLRASLPFSL